MDEIARRFGENLRRARAAADLTQDEVAGRASLHRTEIGLLERGERMAKLDTIIKLAGAVGASISDLVYGMEWELGDAEFRPGERSRK